MVLMLLSVVRMTRIGAGYVGVEVNLAGSQRGTQDIPVRTGWVFYSPLKTQVIEFPTFRANGEVDRGRVRGTSHQ